MTGLTRRLFARATRSLGERTQTLFAGLDDQYRLLFQGNPSPMWVFDKETLAFLAVNEAAVSQYGYTRDEFLSMTLFDIRAPQDREAVAAHARGGRGTAGRSLWQHRKKDGRVIDVRVTASDLLFGTRPARLVVASDMSAELGAEALVRTSEARYRDLFENAGEPIATVDLNGTFTEVNRAFENLLGYGRDELVGSAMDAYLIGDGIESANRARQRKLLGETEVTTYEQEFLTRDGSHVTVEVATRVIWEDGRAVGVQGMGRDVTERKRAVVELRRLSDLNRHLAQHDTLTGLPNRSCFHDGVEQALATADRPTGLIVMLLDLLRFKDVNDTLGHSEGDRLLVDFAERLKTALPRAEITARVGGDEFGVLLDAPADPRTAASEAATCIREALARPFLVRGLPIEVDVCIGTALGGFDGADAATLLEHADLAMYAAKEEREPHVYYSPKLDRADKDRLLLVADLRRALGRRELVLDYQPSFDLRTGRIACTEALVRWRHPTRGLLRPDEFIPLAEQTGLIAPLTTYVLEEALRQQNRWESLGYPVKVAVNVSARSLRDSDLAVQVARLLHELGVPAERLVLEATESAIIHDPARAKVVLDELGSQGVQIALDDFGTGFSSLAYLRRLPLDQIKIDRSFVSDVTTDEDNAAIVRSIGNLGHELGLEVVAEGIEDAATLRLLQDFGCDFGQGFHLGRPQSPDAMTVLLGRERHLAESLAAA